MLELELYSKLSKCPSLALVQNHSLCSSWDRRLLVVIVFNADRISSKGAEGHKPASSVASSYMMGSPLFFISGDLCIKGGCVFELERMNRGSKDSLCATLSEN